MKNAEQNGGTDSQQAHTCDEDGACGREENGAGRLGDRHIESVHRLLEQLWDLNVEDLRRTGARGRRRGESVGGEHKKVFAFDDDANHGHATKERIESILPG